MSDLASMHREAFYTLCDELIYTGMSRAVWTSKMLPDCVIKVEERSRMFQNIVEWETWQRVKDTPLSRWFAECKFISPGGSVLVMERTRPASDREYPQKMPAFLNDFKRRNFGMVGKHLVCHDYGITDLISHGASKRMVNAKWSDCA
jgi:hypothetical protein